MFRAKDFVTNATIHSDPEPTSLEQNDPESPNRAGELGRQHSIPILEVKHIIGSKKVFSSFKSDLKNFFSSI